LFQRPFIYLTALQAVNLKRYAPAATSTLSPAARQRLLLQARQELQQVTTTASESSALHHLQSSALHVHASTISRSCSG
jgi:hypothetical protein